MYEGLDSIYMAVGNLQRLDPVYRVVKNVQVK
jgi:hypothetical protein